MGNSIKQLFSLLCLLLPLLTTCQEEVQAIFVGNNKEGTVSIIDAKTLTNIKTVDIAPDKEVKFKQNFINRLATRKLGPKYVDDIDILPDGKTIVISRPYFADIAAFDIDTEELLWQIDLKERPDHQVITQDGKYLYVSLLLSKKGMKIDLEKQKIIGYYATGRRPHSIVLNHDETRLYNGSLEGNDIVIIDTETLEEINRLNFPSGVRPFKIDQKEEYLYLQLSFCHCLAKYDLIQNRIVQQVDLPIPEFVEDIPLRKYPFDAAHHGIGISSDKKYLSVAATVSNYTAILSFPELELIKTFESGIEPSWITDGFDDDTFFVSARGSDNIFVFSYEQQKLLKTIAVGDYPQRMTKGIWLKEE